MREKYFCDYESSYKCLDNQLLKDIRFLEIKINAYKLVRNILRKRPPQKQLEHWKEMEFKTKKIRNLNNVKCIYGKYKSPKGIIELELYDDMSGNLYIKNTSSRPSRWILLVEDGLLKHKIEYVNEKINDLESDLDILKTARKELKKLTFEKIKKLLI